MITVSGFLEANKFLDEISNEIVVKTNKLEDAREIYLTAKAVYENAKAAAYLTAKISTAGASVKELEAVSETQSYEKRLEYVKAESSYKRLSNEIRALRDRMEAMREQSYNLRMERKL